jgi:hypothetical protein
MTNPDLERAGELIQEAMVLTDSWPSIRQALQTIFEQIDAQVDYEDERTAAQDEH